jgi:hypothetical protein
MAAVRQDYRLIAKFGGTLNGGTIYICRAEGPARGPATPRRSDSEESDGMKTQVDGRPETHRSAPARS